LHYASVLIWRELRLARTELEGLDALAELERVEALLIRAEADTAAGRSASGTPVPGSNSSGS
jgi:hypothetical protein